MVLEGTQKELQFSPDSTEKKLNMTLLQETHSTLANEPDWKREWVEQQQWGGSSSPKTLHLSPLL